MKKIKTKNQKKKAMSVMLEYVLLIVFAIVLSTIAYAVLKTYIPKDKMDCPEGTSLIIETYDCDDDQLTFSLRNDGKFDVGGYFIYAVDRLSEREIKPTINLVEYNTEEASKLSPLMIEGIKLGLTLAEPELDMENDFKVNQESQTETYTLTDVNRIYAIEIVPLRWQDDEDGVKRTVSCADQKVRKSIDCS